MKNLSLAITIALVLVYIIVPHSKAIMLGLSTSQNGIERITYLFLHANAVHLIVNLLCLLSLSFLSGARVSQFLVSIIIASTIPNVLIGSIPMLGMSSVNFALTGMLVMKSRRWAELVMINVLLVVITIPFSNIATSAHLYGFLVGAIFGYINKPQFDE